MVTADTRALLTAIALALVAAGCIGIRRSTPSSYEYLRAPDSDSTATARPLIGYRLHFIGNTAGSRAFEERVARVFAAHPLLAHAGAGDAATPFHLELTLSNRFNHLVAVGSGILCGLTFTLLPGYARDDFELIAELSSGSEMLQRFAYRDSVLTVVHLSLALVPRASQPTAIVEAVVDEMLMHFLHDLDDWRAEERRVSPD